MSTYVSAAGQALLGLLANPGRVSSSRLEDLRQDEWQQLLDLALTTRTFPLLADAISHLKQSTKIAVEIRSRLDEAIRLQALTSVSQAKGLADLSQILREAEFEFCALKGAGLAFRDYPQPHLRVMRDVDLLLPLEQAELAKSLLLERERYELLPWAGDYGVEHSHQLPEIKDNETGLVIELHHRLSANEHFEDSDLVDLVWGNRSSIELMGETVSVPNAEANLLHLVKHAAHHHAFSNGPVILADIHFLCANNEIDWGSVCEGAERTGLVRPLTLIATLASHLEAHWAPAHLVESSQASSLVEDMQFAMLADQKTHRQSALIRRQLERDGIGSDPLSRLFAPDRHELARLAQTKPDSLFRWRGYPRWLIDKGGQFWSSRRNEHAHDLARATNDLTTWFVAERN